MPQRITSHHANHKKQTTTMMQQFDATIRDATTVRAEDGPAPPLPDLAETTCSASQRESRTVPETGGE